MSKKNVSLTDLYSSRLQVEGSDLRPDVDTLRLLTERHLQHIPFENLSMHTSSSPSKHPTIAMTTEELIEKLLVQRRGGCCLELNGLFAELLENIGFEAVRLVPCWVCAGPE